MRLIALSLCAVLVSACGDDGAGADIDAPTSPDGGNDAGTDTAVDAMPVAPVVTITSHTDDQRITGSRTITVAGTLATDDTITAVTVAVGAAAPVAATFDQTTFSASITLGDNANEITVTATDSTAAAGSESLTLVFPYIALTNFQSAAMVLGHSDFTTLGYRNADASRTYRPGGRAVEIGGTIYVSEYDGHRVVGFRGFPSENGGDADFALGQLSLTSELMGTSATRLNGPMSIAGHGGRMYLVDHGNSRILIWNTPPTTTGAPADAVIGQAGMTASTQACTATGLDSPRDMTVAGDRLIVADAENNRVLVWNTVPTTGGVPPDVVLGQADFTHCASSDDNQDGVSDATPSARTFWFPNAVWSDGTRLLVADTNNHRVLVWQTFPTTSFQAADFILGQTTPTAAGWGGAADQFNYPTGIESNGNQLFIADNRNHRVKVWNSFPTSNRAADAVLGQSDFQHTTRNDDNQDGTYESSPTARTLYNPSAVWLLRDRLFVSDYNNLRVLLFGSPVCPLGMGLYEFPAGSGTCVDDPCDPTVCGGLQVCERASGAAVCTCPAGVAGNCDVCVRYVDAAATGEAHGYSWSDAYTDVATAADAAYFSNRTCEVWIKEGTYYTYRTSSNDTIRVRGPVTLRGGFAGNETTAAARSGGATILDGRDAAGGTLDVYHVVSSTTASSDTPAIDRVTIQYGNADGAAVSGTGGGVYVSTNARLAITDSVIQNNRAGSNGGGLVYYGGTGSLTVSGTTFRANYAGLSGGGANVSGGTVTDCDFIGNTVGTTFGHGGGGVTLGGTGTLSDSRFVGNAVTGDGGGVWVRSATNAWMISGLELVANRATNAGGLYFDAAGAAPVLRTSRFVANAAMSSGGALFARDSSPTIDGLTIVGNTAASNGGGIRISGSGAALTNLVVWDNTSPSGADYSISNFTGTITYSDIAGGYTGNGNISAAPGFVHAPVAWDRVTAAPSLDIITVSAGARFAVGDHIEIDDDGIARQVTAVSANDITFTPAVAASVVGLTVQNWDDESANLTADYHLASGSPCIDAGTPTGTDMGAYP